VVYIFDTQPQYKSQLHTHFYFAEKLMAKLILRLCTAGSGELTPDAHDFLSAVAAIDTNMAQFVIG
jgi:hypothetical protein